LAQVLKLHAKLHGNTGTQVRRVERRDARIPRGAAEGKLGPVTEAAFGRKRAAAVAEVAAASPRKRARMLRNAPPGLSRVAQEAAEEHSRRPVAASAEVVARVSKRDAANKERHLRGAVAAAKARARREKMVVQSRTKPPKRRDVRSALSGKAGVALVRLEDSNARRKAERLRFNVTGDPLKFVAQVLKVPGSAKKEHVVIAPVGDSEYSVNAKIAAALLGAFCTTPEEFENAEGLPRGIKYTEKYRNPKHSFHLAVSASLAKARPTLPDLFRAIAQAPGSSFKFYLSERTLDKYVKKTANTTPGIRQRSFVLCEEGDREAAKERCKEGCISPQSFLLRFEASESEVCPGFGPK